MKVDSYKTSLIELFAGEKTMDYAKYFSKFIYEHSLFRQKERLKNEVLKRCSLPVNLSGSFCQIRSQLQKGNSNSRYKS